MRTLPDGRIRCPMCTRVYEPADPAVRRVKSGRYAGSLRSYCTPCRVTLVKARARAPRYVKDLLKAGLTTAEMTARTNARRALEAMRDEKAAQDYF